MQLSLWAWSSPPTHLMNHCVLCYLLNSSNAHAPRGLHKLSNWLPDYTELLIFYSHSNNVTFMTQSPTDAKSPPSFSAIKCKSGTFLAYLGANRGRVEFGFICCIPLTIVTIWCAIKKRNIEVYQIVPQWTICLLFVLQLISLKYMNCGWLFSK